MIVLDRYPVFVAAALVYIISGYAMVLRVGWLKSSGRVPDAPTARQLLLGNVGTAGFTFAFSGRHRAFKDRLTSVTVWALRVATVFAVVHIVARIADSKLPI